MKTKNLSIALSILVILSVFFSSCSTYDDGYNDGYNDGKNDIVYYELDESDREEIFEDHWYYMSDEEKGKYVYEYLDNKSMSEKVEFLDSFLIEYKYDYLSEEINDYVVEYMTYYMSNLSYDERKEITEDFLFDRSDKEYLEEIFYEIDDMLPEDVMEVYIEEQAGFYISELWFEEAVDFAKNWLYDEVQYIFAFAFQKGYDYGKNNLIDSAADEYLTDYEFSQEEIEKLNYDWYFSNAD